MRNLIANYFLLFLKPGLMITTFTCNVIYLKNSQFVNSFYYIIFIATFLMKPSLYLFLFIGLIVTYNLKSCCDYFMTILIILGIFFGFPVEEYFLFFNFDSCSVFFHEKEYIAEEYLKNHYIVNCLVENFPILIFVTVNNFFLMGNVADEGVIILMDPVITNIAYILINGIMLIFHFL